jgi:ATP-binding cassette subfamily C protein LapB
MTPRTDDTLLQCLLALCRYHGNASTPQALTSGLPLEEGCLTPGLFERAAGRVGLVSRIVYKSAPELEKALLPAVLLLDNQGACLLMGWSEDGQQARVIYPEISEAVVEISAEQLIKSDTGQAIICRPRFRFDQRAPRTGTSERGHWLWDAI